jgi:adenylate cyclase
MSEALRKLTAVLVADVQGYTRLMEADEEQTRQQINQHRVTFLNLSKHHGGRVLDTSGDSILAEFASVQLAVECAAKFQSSVQKDNQDLSSLQRMEFRVGVNVGDVLDDGDAIYGDAVNTAARIQALASPGGVCVSGAVQDLVEGRVAFGFQFIREQRVKNKRRSIQVYRMLLEPPQAGSDELPNYRKLPTSSEPAIAVLPFQNLGGDSAQQYFGDGIAEDIITELSRFRSIKVLARTTSFSYRDESDCFTKLSNELNVQYALEGSVRSVGERVRITAQLVDCASGKQLWGDRYTHDADAIFEVQDEVVSLIVGMLENRLLKDRGRSAVRVNSNAHRAYDYWLRGNQLLEPRTRENNYKAAHYFQKAIDLDAGFSRAYTSLAALCYSSMTLDPGAEESHSYSQKAIDYTRRALELDPSDGRAHANIGWGYLLQRDFEKARHHYEIAGDLNPNDADILVGRGRAQVLYGNNEGALDLVSRALRLNPVHPAYYLQYQGLVQLFAGRFEDSAHTFTQNPPTTPENMALLACAHGLNENRELAAMFAKEFFSSTQKAWRGNKFPDNSGCLKWLQMMVPLNNRADRDLLELGLERAGVSLTEWRPVKAPQYFRA